MDDTRVAMNIMEARRIQCRVHCCATAEVFVAYTKQDLYGGGYAVLLLFQVLRAANVKRYSRYARSPQKTVGVPYMLLHFFHVHPQGSPLSLCRSMVVSSEAAGRSIRAGRSAMAAVGVQDGVECDVDLYRSVRSISGVNWYSSELVRDQI